MGKNARLTWRRRGGEAAAASLGLICQLLSYSQAMLACMPVCKPFAHERRPIRTECWSTGTRIRTKRWPTHARVCKPAPYCSQAATRRRQIALLPLTQEEPCRFQPWNSHRKPPEPVAGRQEDAGHLRSRRLVVHDERSMFLCYGTYSMERCTDYKTRCPLYPPDETTKHCGCMLSPVSRKG